MTEAISNRWWEQNYESKWLPEFGDESMWNALVRSGGRCEYCGVDGTSDARLLAGFHADHLVPKAKGGSDAGLNRVLACTLCNTIKGDDDPSHGAGSPRTQEDRTRMIADAKREICNRAGNSAATRYWRVFHLCCMLSRKGN